MSMTEAFFSHLRKLFTISDTLERVAADTDARLTKAELADNEHSRRLTRLEAFMEIALHPQRRIVFQELDVPGGRGAEFFPTSPTPVRQHLPSIGEKSAGMTSD